MKHAGYTFMLDGDSLWRLEHGQRQKEIIRRKDIGVKMWEFGVKAGTCQETEGKYIPNLIIYS